MVSRGTVKGKAWWLVNMEVYFIGNTTTFRLLPGSWLRIQPRIRFI